MRELVLLLEERSAKAMIEGIIPRITAGDPVVRYIVFEGKQDMEKQLPRKLRGYLNPDAVFIILRDQDSGDCRRIKSRLRQLCVDASRPSAIIRIACRELESWYLADLAAVQHAYNIDGLATHQNERKFRNPDILQTPSVELKRLVPAYQKINGSKLISRHLDLDNNRSRSFNHFIKSVKQYLEGIRRESGSRTDEQ